MTAKPKEKIYLVRYGANFIRIKGTQEPRWIKHETYPPHPTPAKRPGFKAAPETGRDYQAA